MPQKRNPDGAELLRAKAARVTGDLMTLLALQKGLPLGYTKDLQEDKAALFDAEDHALRDARTSPTAMLGRPPPRRRAHARRGGRPDGVPARHRGGRLARQARRARSARRTAPWARWCARPRRRGVALEALPLDAFQAAHPRFDATVYRGAHRRGRRGRALLDGGHGAAQRGPRDPPLGADARDGLRGGPGSGAHAHASPSKAAQALALPCPAARPRPDRPRVPRERLAWVRTEPPAPP